MNRAYRNRPLTERERIRNKLISKKRYIVERVFGTLKRRYGLARASSWVQPNFNENCCFHPWLTTSNEPCFCSLHRRAAPNDRKQG